MTSEPIPPHPQAPRDERPGEPAPLVASAQSRNPYVAAIAVAVVLGGAATFMLLNARSASVAQALSPADGKGNALTARDAAAVADSPKSGVAHRTASTATSKWSARNQGRWISNHPRSLAFELEAENRAPVWMKHVRPVLVVRCLAKTTDVFVFTESAAAIEPGDEDHSVRIALDGQADVVERWPDSVDHDALFAPDGAAFARRLASARTLRFGFTPHNAPFVTVEFDVRGFSDVIAPVAERCGRK